jgi:hypothetical protein
MGSLWEKWQTHNYDVCFVRLPPSFPAVPQNIKDYLLYSRMICRIGQLLRKNFTFFARGKKTVHAI